MVNVYQPPGAAAPNASTASTASTAAYIPGGRSEQQEVATATTSNAPSYSSYVSSAPASAVATTASYSYPNQAPSRSYSTATTSNAPSYSSYVSSAPASAVATPASYSYPNQVPSGSYSTATTSNAPSYSSYSTPTSAMATPASYSYPNQAAAASTLPSISHQALNVQPPVTQSSYQQHIPMTTAVPMTTVNTGCITGTSNPKTGVDNNFVGSSYPSPSYATGMTNGGGTNSTVFKGNATGGLVSEGNPTQCHKIDYEIKGCEMQLVEIELDPSETVIAEAGAMMYLEEGIDFKTKFGDGSEPKQGFFKKLMSAGGRLLTGESLFVTHFSNKGQTKARAAFAAPYPGNIIPINLMNHNNKIICQKDAFLCAAHGTKLTIHFNKKIGSGLFGGEGFILQKLEGDGMAFIHAGGTIIQREMRGEKLRLDTGCLVAFSDGIKFDIQMAPGLKSMFFGGEGLFLATLQGTGMVWLQSLPFSRLADRIIQSAPSIGGKRQGEGSSLTGGFGDMIDGDGFGMASVLGRF